MAQALRTILAPSALVLSFVLSACGGGGGDGGGSSSGGTAGGSQVQLASITQANHQIVAATVVEPLGAVANLNDTTGYLLSGAEVNVPRISLASASTEIYNRMRARRANVVTGAEWTEACSGGGSVKINENTASDTRVTAGDSMTIAASNCKESGLPMLNGSASFKIDSVFGDPINSLNYRLGLTVTFSQFSLMTGNDGVTINGDLSTVVSQNGSGATSVSLSGQSLAFALTASGTPTNSYQLKEYQLSGSDSNGDLSLSGKYIVAGSSSKLAGAYVYSAEMLQPVVVSGSGNPSSGVVIVRGAPATVTITALDSSSVRVVYSEKGDGVATTTNTISWTQFDALN